MTQKSLWKLVPLAAFLAAGLLMFSASANLPAAHAEITTDLDVDDDRVGDGDTIVATFEVDPADGDVEVEFTGLSSSTTIDGRVTQCDCSEDGDDFDEDGITLGIDGADDGSVEIEFDVSCDAEDSFTLRITQDDNATDSISLVCDPDETSTADGNVIIIMDAEGGTTSNDFHFEISGDSTECDETFTLSDGDEEGFDCDPDGDYTVVQTLLSGWALVSIECDEISGAEADVDLSGRRVDITLSDDTESVECTFVNEKSGTATPTATSTPGTPGSVTVQAVPNAVNCNGSSFITVVVRTSAGGSPVDGALVNVSTTLGSVSPGQATTSNGSILTIFTGPANSGGTATITATAGGTSGTATIQVNCSQATAVPPTSVVPTQSPSQPGPIRPPSTGDAGLLSADKDTSFAWEAAVATVIVAGSLLGGVAYSRRRAQG